LLGDFGAIHFVSETIAEVREAIHQVRIRSQIWNGIAIPDKDLGFIVCRRNLSGPVKSEDFVGVSKKATKENDFGTFSLAEKQKEQVSAIAPGPPGPEGDQLHSSKEYRNQEEKKADVGSDAVAA
jgi:hypothetical protein